MVLFWRRSPCDPVVGVLGDGRRLGLEPCVGTLLLQCLIERPLSFVEALEATRRQSGLTELGALGVLGDVDLELPSLACLGRVRRERPGVTGA